MTNLMKLLVRKPQILNLTTRRVKNKLNLIRQ
nr:MAG TPA: hypothetical protein [Crassvirales sp.]